MAGRDKRTSLHFLFPAEIINQNRNGILMRIMEISVNIKYLGKPRSDCSNSQAFSLVYPAKDRRTLENGSGLL